MKALTRFSVGLIMAGLLVLAGCNLNGGSDSGTMSLSLTDAPINASDVSGVYITITGVEYHANGTWSEMTGFDGPKQYNLLELTGDSSELIGDLSLPSGEYTQIRFQLDAPDQGDTAPSNPGSYIEFTDDTQEALFVPSGAQTGYKASADEPFLVPQNGSISITADFDVRQAVVDAGSIHILKPVLRLVVDGQAGHIAGDVALSSSLADGHSVVVFAYEDGAYEDSETESDSETNAFTNAVTSAVVEDSDEDGTLDYMLGFLAEGTYDIVTAEFDGNGELVDGTVNAPSDADVGVTGGETTSLDLNH